MQILNFKMDAKIHIKNATEELDELNTKKKELDEVVQILLICRHGGIWQ